MGIIEQILADKVFFQTWVESNELDNATEKLNLEKDAEF